MGWLRTILLGDVGNRLDIADAEQNIDNLKHDLRNKNAMIDTLRKELEMQKLGLQALTRFLLEKEVIEESELTAFTNKIDAEDGVMNGKLKIEIPLQERPSRYTKLNKTSHTSDIAGTPWEKDSGYKG